MKLISILFISLFAFSNLSEPIAPVKVDMNESSVTWHASKVTGSHFGKVPITEASLDYDNGKINGGSFTMDMTSLTVEDLTDAGSNAKLTGHLKSDDFFSVEKFNTSTMTITNVKGSGNNVEITGDLTIKGITKPVTFPATISTAGGKITATAEITFDRTHYDIKYRSGSYFEDLADRLIYDEVKLDVKLVATL